MSVFCSLPTHPDIPDVQDPDNQFIDVAFAPPGYMEEGRDIRLTALSKKRGLWDEVLLTPSESRALANMLLAAAEVVSK